MSVWSDFENFTCVCVLHNIQGIKSTNVFKLSGFLLSNNDSKD